MKKKKYLFAGGVAILGIIALGGYLEYVSSITSRWLSVKPEPLPRLIFEAKWGSSKSEIGIYWPSGKEGDTITDGFEN